MKHPVISATAEWADRNKLGDAEWQRWWRTDKGASDVYYVQFMAKDNIPFHTLSFPATIMGSKEPWKLKLERYLLPLLILKF